MNYSRNYRYRFNIIAEQVVYRKSHEFTVSVTRIETFQGIGFQRISAHFTIHFLTPALPPPHPPP